MSISQYLYSFSDYNYSSNEYLTMIRDHRDTIVANATPTILDPAKEQSLYRSRLRAYLISKGYDVKYHPAVMIINGYETEFDFGARAIHTTKINGKTEFHTIGNDADSITTIYLPSIEVLNKYMIKANRSG